jgi:transposase
MALAHGVNANLLRKWIQHYRQPVELVTPSPPTTLSVFAPVLSLGTPKSAEVALGVTLPNGVKLALQTVRLSDLSPLLNDLAALPCSASSRD